MRPQTKVNSINPERSAECESRREARREAAKERRAIFCFADSVCGEHRSDQTTAIHETRLELEFHGMERIDQTELNRMLKNIPMVCRESPLKEPVAPPTSVWAKREADEAARRN